MKVTELRSRLEHAFWAIGEKDVTKAIEAFDMRCAAERPDLNSDFEDGIDGRDRRFPIWLELDDVTPAQGVQLRVGYDLTASIDTQIATLAAAYETLTDRKEASRFPVDGTTQFIVLKLHVSRLRDAFGFREAVSAFIDNIAAPPFGIIVEGNTIGREGFDRRIELKGAGKPRILLDALMKAGDCGCSRQDLKEAAWPDGDGTNPRFDNAMHLLRHKLNILRLSVANRKRTYILRES
ncbi:MAG: hypothetical protein RIC55_21530 [Pirellulaceae bacterium]